MSFSCCPLQARELLHKQGAGLPSANFKQELVTACTTTVADPIADVGALLSVQIMKRVRE